MTGGLVVVGQGRSYFLSVKNMCLVHSVNAHFRQIRSLYYYHCVVFRNKLRDYIDTKPDYGEENNFLQGGCREII